MAVQMFTSPDDIDEINDLVHDRWFAATRVHQDGTDLVIPFASKVVSRAARAIFDSELRIHHVRSWNVSDPTQVEIYDFYGLAFDAVSGRFSIEGNIPITVDVEVGAFGVSVEGPG